MLRSKNLKTISKLWAVLGLLGALMLLGVAQAKPPSGAIFTTTPDGGIVNENVHYEIKREVYLDGGPPPNAPQTAAGLDNGWYVFQVTDPSGKYLLSEDPAKCRVFEVEDGVIVRLVNPTEFGLEDGYETGKGRNGVTVPYCHIQDPPTPPTAAGPDDYGPSGRHDTNVDVDHGEDGAIVVQLMPFGTTPNPGGVYKAWIIPFDSYAGDLDAVPTAVKGKKSQPCPDFCAAADPGFGPPRGDVKTDNFKVIEYYPPEVTVRKFHDINGNGEWDEGEPEIGVDQCVDDTTGAVIPCPGGWPYDWTYPLDGGTNTETFYTPHTHVAGISGWYSALEWILNGWAQSAAFLDGADLNITNPVSVYVEGLSRETHEIIFGDTQPGKVYGWKVIDLNADGDITGDTCDPSDTINHPGCAGVPVYLDGMDNLGMEVHEITWTDENGYYEFTDIWPGNYTITVGEPAGFECSYPEYGACYYDDIVLWSGDELGPFDFGDFSRAEVRGRKVIDLNADGHIAGDICDPSDTVNYPGCAGVTIHLDGRDGMDRPVHLTTETCGGVTPPDYCEGKDPGYYEFTDLWPGNYMITVAEPDGFFCSYPDPCRYPVSLQSDEVVSCRTFGDFSKAEVHGRKVIDLNADGDVSGDTCPLDPDPWGNNAGCQGVIIHLDGIDNMGREVHLTTPTGLYGWYSFVDLWPGNYIITVAEPDGFFCSYPDPCRYPVSLESDEVVSCRSFGDFSKAEINVHKFFDADESGTWDPGEADIEGIEFCLYQNGVELDCEYTDENGMVSWTDLMPGTYTVVETLPPGWFSTNGTSWTGTLISDEIADLEFGNVTNCVGLTPGYWSNWDNHYTEAQFLTLLEGTIAEGDIALADFYLTSFGCDGGDALHCMRRFLLANQLTLNLTQHPELPNPSDGSLFYVCQVPGVEGNLGDWLDEALAIHEADGVGYTRDWILWVKTVLDWFANLWIVVGSLL